MGYPGSTLKMVYVYMAWYRNVSCVLASLSCRLIMSVLQEKQVDLLSSAEECFLLLNNLVQGFQKLNTLVTFFSNCQLY